MQPVVVNTHKPDGQASRDILRESTAHHSKLATVQGPKQVRKWLSINPHGVTASLELSKLRVHHQLGIQLRDLRLLDPMLATSYPSAILARERALVVNLEFIKMIVGLDRVFITNLEDPNTTLFVEELQRRLAHPAGSATAMGVSPSTAALGAQLQLQPPAITKDPATDPPTTSAAPHTMISPYSAPVLSSVQHPGLPHLGPHFEELSFDLRVLECALDVVSGYLERQAADLEASAHPALDVLTQKISTSNLERVRRIKNRMVRLATRVETLKELLEKLLDDDSDMKDLNLTAKEQEREELLQRQSLRHSMSMSLSTGAPFDVPIPFSGARGASALEPPMTPLSPQPESLRSSNSSSDLSDDEDVAVVEQLLEAYFMQVDNSWNKLQTLAEYIDDTEDFIAIELDSHRNQLIRLDLLLTSFTASIALITAITSLFAMVSHQRGLSFVAFVRCMLWLDAYIFLQLH